MIAALWRRFRSGRDSLHAAALVLFIAVFVGGALVNAMYFYDLGLALWALTGAALAARPSDVARDP